MHYKKYILSLVLFLQIPVTFALDSNQIETFYYTTTLETIGKYVDNEHTTLGYLYEYHDFLKQKKESEFDTKKLEVIYQLLEINQENITKQLRLLDTSKTNIEIFVKYFEAKHPEYQKNIDIIKNTQVLNSNDENGNTLLKYVLKNGTFADIDFALNRGLDPNNKDILGNIAFYDFIKTGGKFYPTTFIDKLLAGKFDESGTIDIIQNMILKGFDINAVDARNENIIFAALELKNQKILDIILKNPELNLNIKNIDGKNPLAYSLEKLFDKSVLLALISHIGLNINATDNNWNSPLHLFASKEGDYFQEFFKRGININVQNRNGETEIAKIIGEEIDENKIIEKYHLLKSYKPLELTLKDIDGNTPLMKAIQTGKLSVMKELIKDTPNAATTKNKAGQNMLILAASSSGSLEMVQEILKQKVDINLADNEGNTALHYALQNGNYDLIKSLLQAGINLNMLNHKSQNMLTYIVEKNDFSLLHLALQYSPDMNQIITEEKQNGWLLLAKNNKIDMIKLFFKNKLTPLNTKSEDALGETMFSYSIKNKNLELVQLLIESGFDVNEKNTLGKTPLMGAGEMGDANIVNALLLAGAQADEIDTTGKNALLYACIKADENTIQALAKKTKNRNITDTQGNSCKSILQASKTLSKEVYDLIQ